VGSTGISFTPSSVKIGQMVQSLKGGRQNTERKASSLSLTKRSEIVKLRGFESASELYRSSDRRRSAKLVPTSADRGCHVVSATSPSDRNFDFLDPEPLLFLLSSSSNCSRG
jgi:hypothetical protein